MSFEFSLAPKKFRKTKKIGHGKKDLMSFEFSLPPKKFRKTKK